MLSQLPFAIGVVGLAAWLRPVSPRLAVTGGVLALLGAFGHTVVGGAMLLQPLMAETPGRRDAYAALLTDMESWPPMLPFFAAGLLGTVLGLLVLSIAHFRSHRQPRWIAPALWAFLVLEFVGSNPATTPRISVGTATSLPWGCWRGRWLGSRVVGPGRRRGGGAGGALSRVAGSFRGRTRSGPGRLRPPEVGLG